MCYLSTLKPPNLRTALYISELLYTNDCVIIPGLGGFVANTRSAFLNPAQHTFSPPSRKLAFNASLRTNDGLLAHHLSKRSGITYGEALTEIKIFVEDIFNRLSSGEQVWIEKIGALTFDKEQRIQYEPDLTENYLTDSFGLVSIHSPAIRREETAKVKKLVVRKEKKSRQGWRLMELIPAAAVLALLVFNPRIIQQLNTGLAEIIPVKEIFHQPEALYPVVTEDSILIERAMEEQLQEESTPLEVPSETAAPAAEVSEPAPIDSTKVEEVVKEVATISETKNTKHSGATFYIVGGCFRIEENAIKLVEEANLLGYEASLLGKNENGLHVVSLYSSGNMNDIQQHLSEIQVGFEKGAWVLVK